MKTITLNKIDYLRQPTLHPLELEKLLKDVSDKVIDTIAVLNQLQNKLSGGL